MNKFRLPFLVVLLQLLNACQGAESEFKPGPQFSAMTLHAPQLMSVYTPPEKMLEPTTPLVGSLIISPLQEPQAFILIKDDYGLAAIAKRHVQEMPAMHIELLQYQNDVIPVLRGPQKTTHRHWEYSIEPGKIWRDNKRGLNLAVLPFSLREKNANCTHNGVLAFAYYTHKSAIEITNVEYQIASETCFYLKFNAWGRMQANFIAEKFSNRAELTQQYVLEKTYRLPVRPISDLIAKHTKLGADAFNPGRTINPEHVAVYGLVHEGVHYSSACQTRLGDYPFCDLYLLPSYSTAKTIFAGLSFMRMEALFPGMKNELIADYVPECKESGRWNDVTFEHALDMVTGVYNDATDFNDEGSKLKDDEFFFKETHAAKIHFACELLKNKLQPASKMIYKTSDTYLLGVAMNQYLKSQRGEQADIFRDIYPDSHRLKLSPVAQHTMRTYDQVAQPFTGFGLSFYRDDIARISEFLANDFITAPWLDTDMAKAAMQLNADDRGYLTAKQGYRYNHSFWAYNYQTMLGCKQPLWIPELSGYGGISVVLMPNGSSYYNFNDGGEYYVWDAVKTLHAIQPLCH